MFKNYIQEENCYMNADIDTDTDADTDIDIDIDTDTDLFFHCVEIRLEKIMSCCVSCRPLIFNVAFYQRYHILYQ